MAIHDLGSGLWKVWMVKKNLAFFYLMSVFLLKRTDEINITNWCKASYVLRYGSSAVSALPKVA